MHSKENSPRAQEARFSQLILKEGAGLQRFAFNLTRNKEDAMDLVQDTYLKAIKAGQNLNNQTNLKSWLFTIMKNTFINNYRRETRKKRVLQKGDDYTMTRAYTKNTYDHIGARIEAKEILERVRQLDDIYRIPFLSYYNGLNYSEIAGGMGITIGTVKSRIFTARKRLKDEIGALAA